MRLDCVSLGIAVDCVASRPEVVAFVVEAFPSLIHGEGLVVQQPDLIAFSIIDAKAVGHFMPSVFCRLWRNLPWRR